MKYAAKYVKNASEGKKTILKTRAGYVAEQILEHMAFKIFIILVIILHLSLVFGEPPSYRNLPDSSKGYLATKILEIICCVIYIFRLVLRCIASPKYFLRSLWNWINVVVILVKKKNRK